ncbi:MAG: protein phosphatase 2C domain-containing protein [Propionibacteriaceae bacterium]|nr:protein phosphatase 2C domain-containing protein [Propionibacteriaceae bacterium]
MPENGQDAVLLAARWGAATDVGRKRELNEDSLLAAAPVFLVADGMGGHEAGEVASALVVEAFRPLVGRPLVGFRDLEDAVALAARSVHGLASAGQAPGSTLTGVALSEHGGYPCCRVINIGDSRTYHLSEEGFSRVTTDHSEVQELVDLGIIDAATAAQLPQRNIITRALGGALGPDVRADHYLLPARSGDRFVVCSDGLSGELTEILIEIIARSNPDPQQTAEALVEHALLAGGRDNISVIVVDIMEAVPQWPDSAVDETTLGHEAEEAGEDTLPNPLREVVEDA